MQVYFPIQVHLTQTKTPLHSWKWVSRQALCILCFVISLMAAVGGLQGITEELRVRAPVLSDSILIVGLHLFLDLKPPSLLRAGRRLKVLN